MQVQKLKKLKEELLTRNLQEILDISIDLTKVISEAVTYGPFSSTKVWYHISNFPYGRETTAFTSNVHSLTHLDLPWAIPENEWEDIESLPCARECGITKPPDPSSRNGWELINNFLKKKVVDCVVIDFSYMKQTLLDKTRYASLSEVEEKSKTISPALLMRRSDILLIEKKEEFEEVLLKLCINKKMLQSALEPYRSQINQNTVICFKTLWDTFLSNSYADLSHPFWNSFHPYLLHPYLNFEAVEYLNELKIGGIATDTPGLDCPLYDVVERFSKPALIQFKNEVFSGKAKIKLTANSHFRVVHHTFLSKKKCYIKNLHFPDIVDMESAPETTSKKDISKITRFLFSKQIEGMEVNIITEAGRLIILPIHARRTSLDAVLLKVFYIPENSMNDESR